MLDPLVKQRLLERLQQLKTEGRLLSRDQLGGYYATFRDRFGPDVLMSRDGEALLETMHSIDKDSLAYWLEFKNDEEFPTRTLGGIGGGAASKFGLFRRKETRAWVLAEGKELGDIPINTAVTVAQKHLTCSP